MGPLATAVNLHFCAATTNFKVLEYLLPSETPGVEEWLVNPYWPTDGYLELRPERPGWGVEVNEEKLRAEYVHWERGSPARPDGSTGYI